MALVLSVVAMVSEEKNEEEDRGRHCEESTEVDEKHGEELRKRVAFSEHHTDSLSFWLVLLVLSQVAEVYF